MNQHQGNTLSDNNFFFSLWNVSFLINELDETTIINKESRSWLQNWTGSKCYGKTSQTQTLSWILKEILFSKSMVRWLDAPFLSEKPQTLWSKRSLATTTRSISKHLAWRGSTGPQHTHQKHPLVGHSGPTGLGSWTAEPWAAALMQ